MTKINFSDWLISARNHAKMTQDELAAAVGLGLTQDKINKTERGKRKLKSNEALEVSRVTQFQLPHDRYILNVLGYVGAGAEVIPIDDGDPLYQVHINTLLPEGTVGAIIRGDSMLPIFEDGDLVAYAGETMIPENAVGSTCIVQVADGRMLIKTVRRGSSPGLYTLTSSNSADIEDVELDWAREFVMRLSRKFWRRESR